MIIIMELIYQDSFEIMNLFNVNFMMIIENLKKNVNIYICIVYLTIDVIKKCEN